ncbi:head completion adaptor [Vibrio phage vB_VpS_PG28]|nr:head completion adaptor [Vibrio phage vB_VpS_PG28]
MLLSSVSKLRARLNLNDTPKTNAALSGLLLSVTATFESHLNTQFRRATYEDTFFLDPSNFLTNDPTCVRLFLRGMNPSNLSVKLKSTRLAAGSDLSQDFYSVDPINSYVSIMDIWAKGDYVTVQYESGYETVDEGGFAIYQNVDSNLETAALIFAEYMFVRKYGDESDTADDGDYTTPPHSVLVILGRYDRHAPHTIKPRV